MTLLIALAVVTACASRDNLMEPVKGHRASADVVDMLVATTRKASSDKSQLFSGERGDDVVLANVVVSLPPRSVRRPGTIQWPSVSRAIESREFVTLKASQIGQREVSPWFSGRSPKTRGALIFVHGFNTTLSEASFRFAQFSYDLDVDLAPVLFTWPSRGRPLDYAYDWESTVYSRFGLVELIDKAAASQDVDEIFVVAHSMGAWLTMESLRQIGIRDKAVSPKIKAVILASPDIDVDVFKRQVLEMGDRRPAFLVVASRDDRALSLSRWLAGGVDRLGGADLRSHISLLSSYGITVVDATGQKSFDELRHSSYAESDVTLSILSQFIQKQYY